MRVLIATMLVLVAAAPGAAAIDFLLPGMPLASASLAPGERAVYRVITRSLGSVDTSFVEMAVLERRNGRLRIEISFGAYPRRARETTTVRMRLDERVLSISSGDEFRPCLLETLIREGSGSFRAATVDELDDLGIDGFFVAPDAARSRTALAPERVRTEAGTFACAGVATARRDERDVTLGGVRAKRVEEERTVLWRSDAAPLWGLVKASVERRSAVERPGAAFPGAPRVTITESTLVAASIPRSKR